MAKNGYAVGFVVDVCRIGDLGGLRSGFCRGAGSGYFHASDGGDLVILGRVSVSESVSKVVELVEFGFANKELRYQLEIAQDDGSVCTDLDGNRICISVPKRIAEKWIDSEEITVEAEQSLGTDRSLRILIEKDFACFTEREGEDETDAFPNPAASGMC
jgi:hypothetical protein